MDDGRLAGEMTLEGLGETVRKINDRLEAIDSKMTAMDSRIGAMDSKMSAMDSKMSAMDSKIDGVAVETRQGFTRVDTGLRQAKIRDERLQSLMTFGLEAREVVNLHH